MLNDDDDAATGDGDGDGDGDSTKIERGKLTDYAAYARYVRQSKCREKEEGDQRQLLIIALLSSAAPTRGDATRRDATQLTDNFHMADCASPCNLSPKFPLRRKHLYN